MLFPKDSSKGGTWIGVTEKNRTLCLLNGAFIKHNVTGNYFKSRGLVVLDFFKADDRLSFIDSYSLDGIEPFTLIIIDNTEELSLTELKWDGTTKHVTKKNVTKCHIWSSSTLYSAEEAEEKQAQFSEHISPDNSAEELQNYHEFGTAQSPELMAYINSSNSIETISITQIVHSKYGASMTYKSLLDARTDTKRIKFIANKIAI